MGAGNGDRSAERAAELGRVAADAFAMSWFDGFETAMEYCRDQGVDVDWPTREQVGRLAIVYGQLTVNTASKRPLR